MVVEPLNLDRSQDLPLTASERQTGGKKAIVLDSGKRLEVTLPAGLKVGQRLRLQGEGERDPATGAVGDVYLVVQEKVVQEQSSPLPQTPSSRFDFPQPTRRGESELKNRSFDLPDNGGKLEFIAVPGGTLTMEGGHKVNLQPFLMGKYPITQRQYQAVMGQNPSHFKGENHPVEKVNWHEARSFCQKLSELLGQQIDLPSETQWEWAARGATQSQGFEYAGSNNLDEVGWYNRNSGNQTHPVGQKRANELGLYDMSGNVWEWCKDSWGGDVKDLPVDGSPLMKGSFRLLRGGSWGNNAGRCRSAFRNDFNPDYRFDDFGFRVVCRSSRTR